ncbi:sensor histidine kinase [Paenibacillus abyssi]|uniref:histidine kinase n=1 Tax=Paenibacillus abyssi TaxID=1340531 RepID=A0A917CPI6_9BACL|nr:histidine kinase [Paenibacillus abyssi]GGF94426.1 hypothetical protein GCM10010916_09720 [Paenibacillus abyssi]
MKRIFSWFYERYTRKIQLRLTIYFLLILLPLVIVSLFVNFRSQNILLERTVERTETALASSMDYIDLTLQNVEEISTLVATDNNMLRTLSQIGAELDAMSYIRFADIMKELGAFTSINNMVSQVSLFHSQSGMLLSTAHGGSRIVRPLHLQELRHLAESNGTGIMYLMPDYPITETETFGSVVNTDSISLVRVMDLNNPAREPNLLIFTFNKGRLLDLIRSLLPSPNADIYLYTNDQELVAGTGDRGLQFGDLRDTTPGEFAVRVDSRYYKWSLLLLQPEEELIKETYLTRMYTYIIIGISVILALLISWAVYSGIASPVQRLLKGMHSVGSGNFNTRLENNRSDELGYLTNAFNKMVQDQKDSIQYHYEQQLRLTRTELKFLQSQINPHFLYNTLDSIYWTAKNYDAAEISEMVLNLSRFFRLSLDKGRDTFTVEENVTHLHYYIRIQQLRFLDSFSVTYDLQEESKPFFIMKLLLQPLVENAILHGLDNKHDGHLHIASRIEQEYLILSVSDNGAGIGKERLDDIHQELEKLSSHEFGPFSYMEQHIKGMYGLRNVLSRIKMYYGDQADLQISSGEGQGTTVKIILPLDRCEETFRLKPFPNQSF